MARKNRVQANSDAIEIKIAEYTVAQTKNSAGIMAQDEDRIVFSGQNTEEVMKFCGAYHVVCTTYGGTVFLLPLTGGELQLLVGPGQSIIKDDDGMLRVID